MFGYVRINKMDLTFREYENYKGYYCGLCKYLKENQRTCPNGKSIQIVNGEARAY